MRSKERVCELCERHDVQTTIHHLIPREEGGRYGPTALLCIPCHKQIHALYTNKELAIKLNTIEALNADETINKYVKWIKKQPSSVLVKVKKSKKLRK